MKTHAKLYFTISILIATLTGCSDFLDKKPDKQLTIPSSLRDLQALLDADNIINAGDIGDGELASDDYYLPDEVWAALFNDVDRRAYSWAPDYSTTRTGWSSTYRNIYYANIVLEQLENFRGKEEENSMQLNEIAGQAYFIRAKGHLAIQLIYSLAYDKETAENDLGVPLRLTSDFNLTSSRPSSKAVYSQIISDLDNAITYLPVSYLSSTRPNKIAAYALLARTYLFMRDYENCFYHANAALSLRNELLDYNELNPSASNPIPPENIEVLYQSYLGIAQPLRQGQGHVDTTLLSLYDGNDLRKTVFFMENSKSKWSFKGSYMSQAGLFSGIALDEVYLMRAESHVRLGRIAEGMLDLNTLLSKRYRKDTHTPFFASTEREALDYILVERRKQLLFRGLRFPDVKRLNMEGENISFYRILNGRLIALPPNDLRWALWIAEDILERAPEIIQNLR